MTKALVFACLAAPMALLVGCNDNTTTPTAANPSPSPSASPSPTGCTQTTLVTATPMLSWNVLNSTAFTTTQAGTVDITVDWQNASTNVGAFVVQAGTCTQQNFNKSKCTFVLASGNDKPHKMSASLPAGSFELLLNDFGGGTRGTGASSSETATVQIVQSSGCTASPNPCRPERVRPRGPRPCRSRRGWAPRVRRELRRWLSRARNCGTNTTSREITDRAEHCCQYRHFLRGRLW